VLDIGAGDGVLSYWLKKNGKEPTACDIAPEKFVVEGVKCYYVDLNYKMPYKKESFDIVAGCEVIEHIENHKGMTDEVHRVLKPNGTFVFTTPNIHNWYSKLYFLFKNQFPYFRDGDYCPLGHTRPLIMNLFKEHIKGKFIIEKMVFNRSFIPLIHVRLPWRNLWFGETMIVKLKKI
jgi:ubiquinone/menaquinone biosynthesis C-methylase UbiE